MPEAGPFARVRPTARHPRSGMDIDRAQVGPERSACSRITGALRPSKIDRMRMPHIATIESSRPGTNETLPSTLSLGSRSEPWVCPWAMIANRLVASASESQSFRVVASVIPFTGGSALRSVCGASFVELIGASRFTG